MINFDDYTNEKKTEHNSKWPCIPDHPYRILLIGGSRSGKTNPLLNLINNQRDIDKMYLYAKDPYETKYQYLTGKHEKVELYNFNDPKAFIEYQMISKMFIKILKNTFSEKKLKVLIVFDDMIA